MPDSACSNPSMEVSLLVGTAIRCGSAARHTAPNQPFGAVPIEAKLVDDGTGTALPCTIHAIIRQALWCRPTDRSDRKPASRSEMVASTFRGSLVDLASLSSLVTSSTSPASRPLKRPPGRSIRLHSALLLAEYPLCACRLERGHLSVKRLTIRRDAGISVHGHLSSPFAQSPRS
jgi:hypothetical protein